MDSDSNYRIKPAQRRSTSRLDEILNVAAAILDQSGMDGLTTAAIAERAGMSIGSVYRYFKDRHAVCQALAQRHMDRYLERFVQGVLPVATNYVEATDGAIKLFGDMFRTEPGFRALRFGDIIDEYLLNSSASNNEGLSAAFAQVAVDIYGVPDTPDTAFHINLVVELSDALLTRAYLSSPEGDPRFIEACHELVRNYLQSRFGPPA